MVGIWGNSINRDMMWQGYFYSLPESLDSCWHSSSVDLPKNIAGIILGMQIYSQVCLVAPLSLRLCSYLQDCTGKESKSTSNFDETNNAILRIKNGWSPYAFHEKNIASLI
jgi:hypothetical protein